MIGSIGLGCDDHVLEPNTGKSFSGSRGRIGIGGASVSSSEGSSRTGSAKVPVSCFGGSLDSIVVKTLKQAAC